MKFYTEKLSVGLLISNWLGLMGRFQIVFFFHVVYSRKFFNLPLWILTYIINTHQELEEAHRIHLPLCKKRGGKREGGWGLKNIWVWRLDFKLWGEVLPPGSAKFVEGQWGTQFSEGARFSWATMFFCKRVISPATLLLIIDVTIYILISLPRL